MLDIRIKKRLHAAQGEMLLDITIVIEKGKFISFYGKSGAGKSTLLKMIAGLVQPDGGLVRAAGETWFDSAKRIHVTPQKREIGFVFQDYTLFPNMTVAENLKFAAPNNSDKKEIEEILTVMGLNELALRYPATLSGGQQQRVALARALVRKPKLLLLDEPFSALDNEMKRALQDEIGKIHRHFELTTILISHDPSEIYRLSDLVVEIDHGKIVKMGLPESMFHQQEISGKIQLMGEVLHISQNDVVFIAKIISGNRLFKVIITRQQASEIAPGDKVLIVAKAFNPVLIKVN